MDDKVAVLSTGKLHRKVNHKAILCQVKHMEEKDFLLIYK